jgi:hypothetical protein
MYSGKIAVPPGGGGIVKTATVNGMSKTSKNHPQTMAHHNLFDRQSRGLPPRAVERLHNPRFPIMEEHR